MDVINLNITFDVFDFRIVLPDLVKFDFQVLLHSCLQHLPTVSWDDHYVILTTVHGVGLASCFHGSNCTPPTPEPHPSMGLRPRWVYQCATMCNKQIQYLFTTSFRSISMNFDFFRSFDWFYICIFNKSSLCCC